MREKGRRGRSRFTIPFYRNLKAFFSQRTTLLVFLLPHWLIHFILCADSFSLFQHLCVGGSCSLVFGPLPFFFFLSCILSFHGPMALGTIFIPMTAKFIPPAQNFLLNSRLIDHASASTSPPGGLMDVSHP